MSRGSANSHASVRGLNAATASLTFWVNSAFFSTPVFPLNSKVSERFA